MAQEAGTLDKKSARYQAVNEVVRQADKYLDKIEKTAEKCIEQADRIYLNPPQTLLDPKVSLKSKSRGSSSSSGKRRERGRS